MCGAHRRAAWLLGLALCAASATAHAEVAQVTGTTGYLSEWQFEVALAKPARDDAFSTPVTWKHIGLCSANGPVEKPGELDVRVRRIGPWSRIQASVSFEDMRCSYSGPYSATVKGVMDCTGRKTMSLPIALSFR